MTPPMSPAAGGVTAAVVKTSKTVPGSPMPIATPDPAKRAAIIAHLKTEGTK